ncbi:MAG TPA: transglycosylase family protein [Solirubrobacterales bacterium]
MVRTPVTKAGPRRPAVLASALLGFALLSATVAGAAGVGDLEAKVSAARGEASSLAASLQAAQSELAAAQEKADAASAREEELAGLLATGEERAARLVADVRRTQRRLAAEKRRLHRARAALAARLVAIYESGSPSTASVILASGSFDELATRTEYLERIERSDSDLAGRVAQVRRTVAAALERIATLKAKVDAYNTRLAAARSEIAGVRQEAEAAAAQLHSVAASRSASLSTLKSKIGSWVSDIEAAEAASQAEAETTVERWLGGPYSIPTYIVMCESGGNYGAVNPSSGAGGAYQILPSTWELYGGEGAPHEAPKAEQDRIAAEIWADSGGGAWVCA